MSEDVMFVLVLIIIATTIGIRLLPVAWFKGMFFQWLTKHN
jgi:hypothetical protein